MGSVTVKTAAATQAILDQTIKSAAIKLDELNPAWAAYAIGDLICTRWDDTHFSAGSAIGPVGPAGPINAADLTALKNDTGYGALWHDKVTTVQTWADLVEDVWHTITGLQVTFDKTVDRLYRVELAMLMLTEDPAGAEFAAEVIDPDDNVIARFSDKTGNDGRAINVGGSLTFEAGNTQPGLIYTVRARASTGWQVDVKSDYVPTRLTIEDVGKI